MKKAATVVPRMKPASVNPEFVADFYFSADVETDGPIPGPYSMLSFAIVSVGTFDGAKFNRVSSPEHFRCNLRPISPMYDPEALLVNGIDRKKLFTSGEEPSVAMTRAAEWVRNHAGMHRPILVAYPLSFDWTWLYWYFVRYSAIGSPFAHSSAFDVKTAFAVKAGIPVAAARKSRMPSFVTDGLQHTHDPLDDALEQGELFARLFEWAGHLESDAAKRDFSV